MERLRQGGETPCPGKRLRSIPGPAAYTDPPRHCLVDLNTLSSRRPQRDALPTSSEALPRCSVRNGAAVQANPPPAASLLLLLKQATSKLLLTWVVLVLNSVRSTSCMHATRPWQTREDGLGAGGRRREGRPARWGGLFPAPLACSKRRSRPVACWNFGCCRC